MWLYTEKIIVPNPFCRYGYRFFFACPLYSLDRLRHLPVNLDNLTSNNLLYGCENQTDEFNESLFLKVHEFLNGLGGLVDPILKSIILILLRLEPVILLHNNFASKYCTGISLSLSLSLSLSPSLSLSLSLSLSIRYYTNLFQLAENHHLKCRL